MRHGAHAQLLVAVLEFHLVVPLQLPGLHAAHGLHREVEDHGLLDPFVHPPFALLGIDRLGRPQEALVHEPDHVAHGLLRRCVAEPFALLPRLLYGCSEFFVHGFPFSCGSGGRNGRAFPGPEDCGTGHPYGVSARCAGSRTKVRITFGSAARTGKINAPPLPERLRRDYFFRQLEQHDWPYAVRVSGLSVSTFQACFAGDTPHKKRSTQAGQQFDEFRLWQVLQKEDSSAAGIALWMSWQMGVQGKELVNLTWDQVDLERGLLHLPERDMLLTNAVRRLLEKVQKVRSPGEDPHVLLSPQSRRPMDLARLSKVVQTALIRGGLENITLQDIRAAGGQREDDQTLLEWTRAHGSITRRDVMALLNLSDTAAYLRLRRLVGRRELEQVGKKYYLPGTVVPEEKQWEVISAYLQEAGFAYCQDVAELLHVGKRKTAGILRRMVRDGQLLQFEKRYYLAKQPGQKQIQ